VSDAVPAGEEAELARLRVVARRLGVSEDVQLLSPWTPLQGAGTGLASGAADLLLRYSPVPVLGVTGSAGKTTTARLAEAMLGASGVETLSTSDAPADNAWPTADLIVRALAARPPAWCVAELTSNHLAVCSASPRIACITNVWADHVDQHGSLASYLEAKRRIVAFQAHSPWPRE
jgi:UDP-N-acetylmuramoylalanine--D-glutamate ligase